MNNMKKKVMASAAMLLVAAVMMTGSSFAWYTISTKGEMDQIEVELKATKNLEIAKATSLTATPSEAKLHDADATDEETRWGSTITDWGTVERLDVPATLEGTDIKTASYSESGRVDDLKLCATPSSLTNGVGYYTTTLNDVTGVNAAVVYAAWLRSNVDLTDVEAKVENDTDAKIKTIVRWHKDTDDDTVWHKYDPDVSADVITLDANEPILVEVIGYIEGDDTNGVHASDVANGYNMNAVKDIKLTFYSAALDNAITSGQAGTNPTVNKAQKTSGVTP